MPRIHMYIAIYLYKACGVSSLINMIIVLTRNRMHAVNKILSVYMNVIDFIQRACMIFVVTSNLNLTTFRGQNRPLRLIID